MNSAFKLSVVLAFLVASSSLQASLPKPLTILKGAAALSFVIYKWVELHTTECQKVDQQIALLQSRVNQIAQSKDDRINKERVKLQERIDSLCALREHHFHS